MRFNDASLGKILAGNEECPICDGNYVSEQTNNFNNNSNDGLNKIATKHNKESNS